MHSSSLQELELELERERHQRRAAAAPAMPLIIIIMVGAPQRQTAPRPHGGRPCCPLLLLPSHQARATARLHHRQRA